MEKEEEKEEEALPLDMMDEDDLKLMEELAQKASFITRDLSSKWVLAKAKLNRKPFNSFLFIKLSFHIH